MRVWSSVALACGLLVGSLPGVLAQPAATPVAAGSAVKAVQYTTVEGITEYRLPNGLRVLLAPDASKPTTTVNITFMVGSRHEGYGETGMAHLLEHLVFKGTPSLPGKTIVQEFARRGMQMNGTTFYDRTNYFETFTASDENLEWALTMEADRMVNSVIAKSDLDSEMTVVRNEMESGENDPGRTLWERMTATAYQWHNYGKSTIGARTDVENVRIENLQAFYRKYYQPDNATLIVTGKFDAARTLAHIEKVFGAIAKPQRELPPLYTRDPVQDGAREVSVARVGDSHLVGTIYHIAPGAHADATHADLLAFIMGDTPSGRLHKSLVERKKAANVSADALALHDPGYLLFFVGLNKAQSRDEARKLLIEVVEGVRKQPITEAELRRAKTALLNAFEKSMANPVSFGIALSEAVAQGDWRLYFLRRDRIENATVADVQRVAENYLVESNRTFGQFIATDKPVRASLPAAPDLQQLVGNYQGRAAVGEGEAFDPDPANIEKRTQRGQFGNGLQWALLPKATRGNTVQGQLVLRMGDEKTLFGKRETAKMVAQMLLRGSATLSRQQIAYRLDELKAKIDISTRDGNAVVVRFETRRQHLPATLALLAEVLRRPAFVASEFESLRTEWITSVEEQRRQPDALAQNTLARHDNPYPKGDVRHTLGFDDEVAAIKAVALRDLGAFHQRFYGANAGQVAIVGDFDAAAIKAQVQEQWGAWNAKARYTRVPTPHRPTRATQILLETPDKANAFYIAGVSLPVKDDSPDAPALVLANRVLGGDGLKSRIADRLRQKDGISYGAGSFLQISPVETNATLGLYAIYAPQKLAAVQQAVAEEMTRFAREGVSEQELEDARNGLLQAAQLQRSQDGTLAGTLANQAFLGRTMQFVIDHEQRLRKLTAADVNATIARHIDAAKMVHVYAGDFAGAKKGG